MFEIRRHFKTLGIGTLVCAAATACSPVADDASTGDHDDIFSNRYPVLAASCSVNGSGDVTFTMASNETLYMFKRPADGLVVANAPSATSSTECTFATTKKITINGDNNNNHKVLLDYYNGTFGMATAVFSATNALSGVRTVVALGTGTGNQVKFRGTANYDTFTFGTLTTTNYLALGVGTATTAPAARTFPDVSMTGVSDILVSSGPGNDIITGQGGTPIGGTAAAPGALAGTIAMTLYGGDGNDTLTSGAAGVAVNYLYGEAGNDLFLQQVAKAHDVISGTNNGGAADTDTVDYSNRSGALTVTLGDDAAATQASGAVTCVAKASNTDNDQFTINDGTTSKTFEYQVTGGFVATGGGVIAIDITADVTAGDVGTTTAAAITGAGLTVTVTDDTAGGLTIELPAGPAPAGAAITLGGANVGTVAVTDFTGGSAAITANDGESTELDSLAADIENVIGGSAGDIIDASLATLNAHVLQGMGGDDTLTGSSLADTLWGGAGNDTLSGGLLADTINGGDGNDTIIGGTGNDTIDGGGLNCVALSSLACTATVAAKSTVAGVNPGVNTLDYSDRGAGAPVIVDLSNLAMAVQVGEAGEKDVVTAASITNVRGGAGADTLTGDTANNIIWGGAGIDTIAGGSGDDTIYGEAGDDVIHGDAGNDVIVGGTGTNQLFGDAGNDLLDNTSGTAGTLDCGAGDADIGLTNGTETSNLTCR